MMAFDFEQARFNMIEQQVRPWEVLDKTVLEVLKNVPREAFVPEDKLTYAFSDMALPIGHGEVMMPPVVEGRMLQALALQSGDAVLEIGTGTGFMTACMASLAASVHSVDIHADFIESAQQRLNALNVCNVRLEVGDAHESWDTGNRFDVIAITGALSTDPIAYMQQLTVGGRLFCIVGAPPAMQAKLITRVTEDQFVTDALFETCLPWLKGAEPKPRFEF